MDQYEIETLIKNIDDRTSRIEQILPTVATKEDLNAFATKEDLNAFATKEDLRTRSRRRRILRLTRRRKTCAKRASERVDTLMSSPTASRRASRLSPTDTKGWTTGSPAWAEISSQYLPITNTESRCWKRTRPNDDSGDQTRRRRRGYANQLTHLVHRVDAPAEIDQTIDLRRRQCEHALIAELSVELCVASAAASRLPSDSATNFVSARPSVSSTSMRA